MYTLPSDINVLWDMLFGNVRRSEGSSSLFLGGGIVVVCLDLFTIALTPMTSREKLTLKNGK